jgi:hypothetical protein
MNCPYPCSVRAMLIGCTGALTLWGRACMLHNLATRLRCLAHNLWVIDAFCYVNAQCGLALPALDPRSQTR